MPETKIMPSQNPAPNSGTEANFLGGILRRDDEVGGWTIREKIAVMSGEAELYLAELNGATGVVKYYRDPRFAPKYEVIAKLKSWKHEDVVNLLDTGRNNGHFYEVMEYAAGGALNSTDNDGAPRYLPLSEDMTIQLVREAVNGLKVCHEAGIIHRDIKPANIYYRNADGTDFVLGDFGISSALDSEMSKRMTGNINGTYGYSAPELQSKVVGPEVDYYALGITVFEVLTGKYPFEGRNEGHVIRDTLEGRIIDDLLSREDGKKLSSRMITLIRGLLTHRHDKRWGYRQVQDWLEGKNVDVFSEPARFRSEPFTWEGKVYPNAEELANAMIANPEGAKKLVFRGLIESWLAKFDQQMALHVGDLREEAGDKKESQTRVVFQVALMMNPAIPFTCDDGTAIESISQLKKVLETIPGAVVSHLKNPDDVLWHFLTSWGLEEATKGLPPLIAKTKSTKKIVNLFIVVFNGKVIRPFENTPFAGTELSNAAQLETLPKSLKSQVAMELEDENSLISVWLEAVGPIPSRSSSLGGQSDVRQTPGDQPATHKTTKPAQDTSDHYLAEGVSYLEGKGVMQDFPSAVKFFRQAAKMGNLEAQYRLGKRYELGQGVPKSNSDAKSWYTKSAKAGYARAQYALAKIHEYGPQSDSVQYMKWCKLAADQGYAKAEAALAFAFGYGHMTRTNRKMAAEYYDRARKSLSQEAQQGIQEAQVELAKLLRYGNEWVEVDLQTATELFRAAARSGSKEAQEELRDLRAEEARGSDEPLW